MSYKINNNVTNDQNDWRFMKQDEYLKDKELIYTNYKPCREDWDHEHCEFCGVKFSEYDGNLHKGYCTLDNYYWICEKCFNDFKYMFNWKIVEKNGNM